MEHAHLGFYSLEDTAQCSWLGKAQPRPQTVLSGEGSKEVTFEPRLCLRLGDEIEGNGGGMGR